MSDLIDKAQLQATAQVAKSYILDQDTANVNTIINALQQSGGGSGKQEGIITVDTSTRVISYNGDATLYLAVHYDGGITVTETQSGNTYPKKEGFHHIFAPATDNYTAAVLLAE